MNRSVGLAVMFAGVMVVVIGVLIYLGWFWWFGRLPGDIRYQGDQVQVYVPIASMLLLSLGLSLLFYLLRRFF